MEASRLSSGCSLKALLLRAACFCVICLYWGVHGLPRSPHLTQRSRWAFLRAAVWFLASLCSPLWVRWSPQSCVTWLWAGAGGCWFPGDYEHRGHFSTPTRLLQLWAGPRLWQLAAWHRGLWSHRLAVFTGSVLGTECWHRWLWLWYSVQVVNSLINTYPSFSPWYFWSIVITRCMKASLLWLPT